MADVTKRTSPAPQIDGFSAQHCDYLSDGLQAGVALVKGDACYIDANGRVQKAVSTVLFATGTSYNVTKFDGLVNEDHISGSYGVTLYGAGAVFGYSSGMTVGQPLFVSSTAGALSNTVISLTDRPVAKAVSATDIKILR
jgi:hypothetical protein